MGEHTELPWQVEQGTDLIWGACTPEGEAGYPIVEGKLAMWTRPRRPNGKEREANAAHIVKCVNAHEELIEALRIFLGFDKRFRIKVDGDFGEVEKMHGTIRALYDRVTEQS